MKTTSETATIASYNHGTGEGVLVVGTRKEKVRFSLTCFHSGRPVRSPERGENVEALFSGAVSEGALVSVRPCS